MSSRLSILIRQVKCLMRRPHPIFTAVWIKSAPNTTQKDDKPHPHLAPFYSPFTFPKNRQPAAEAISSHQKRKQHIPRRHHYLFLAALVSITSNSTLQVFVAFVQIRQKLMSSFWLQDGYVSSLPIYLTLTSCFILHTSAMQYITIRGNLQENTTKPKSHYCNY